MAVRALLMDRAILYRAPWDDGGLVEGIVLRFCSMSFDPKVIPNRTLDVPLRLFDADRLRADLDQRAVDLGPLGPGRGGDVTEDPDRRGAMTRMELGELSQAEVGVLHPSAIVVHPVNLNMTTGSRIVPLSIVEKGNKVLVTALHLYDMHSVKQALAVLIAELETGA